MSCRAAARTLLAALILGASLPVFADEPADPTAETQELFEKALKRIKKDKKLPQEVTEAISAIGKETTILMDCPEGSPAKKVVFSLLIKHVRWDPELTVNGKRVDVSETAGLFHSKVTVRKDGDFKIVLARGFLMFEPDGMRRREKLKDIGPVVNALLVYHELLHAQLLIDFYKNAKDELCKCNAPQFSNARDHDIIFPLVDDWLARIKDPDWFLTIVRDVETVADAKGKFRVKIPGSAKVLGAKTQGAITVEPLIGSSHGNVKLETHDIVGNEVFMNGRLIDPKKPGFFQVFIDPPRVYLLAYVRVRPTPSELLTRREFIRIYRRSRLSPRAFARKTGLNVRKVRRLLKGRARVDARVTRKVQRAVRLKKLERPRRGIKFKRKSRREKPRLKRN